MMMKPIVPKIFNSTPIVWPSKPIKLDVGLCSLELEMLGVDKDAGTYEVLVLLRSKPFSEFLKQINSYNLAGLPKMRQKIDKIGSSAIVGQAMLNVLLEGREDTHDRSIVVFAGPYRPGYELNPLGYSTNSEEDLVQFLTHIIHLFSTYEGIYAAHRKNGALILDLGHFDVFYSYLWAGFRSGVTCDQVCENIVDDLSAISRRDLEGSELKLLVHDVFEKMICQRSKC